MKMHLQPEDFDYINQLIGMIKANKKEYVVIHYTGVKADVTAKSIYNYHTKNLGWGTAGYHRLVNHKYDKTNLVEVIEPIAKAVNGMRWSTASWKYCQNAFQIVFETVENQGTWNKLQELWFETFVVKLVRAIPNIKIGGHREYPGQITACPGFDVGKWLKTIGIPEVNIWKP